MTLRTRPLIVVAAAALAALPAVAAADTVIGLPDAQFAAYSPDVNATDPGGSGACSPGPCIIEQDALPGAWGGVRRASAAGVITSWKVKTADARSGLRLRVGIPGNLGTVSFVAAGDVQAAPSAGVHVFAARIPIGAGQGVHLEWTGGGGSVLLSGGPLPSGGGVSIVNDTAVPQVGDPAFVSPQTFISSPSTVLFMQATVEPDADGDGHGDTSQDCQPANAAAQACPPVPGQPTGDAGGASAAVPARAPSAGTPAAPPRLGTVRWSRMARLITARTTVSPGVRYAITATSGRTARRGLCRMGSTVVTCSVRVRPGRWTVKVVPTRDNIVGAAVVRTFRIVR